MKCFKVLISFDQWQRFSESYKPIRVGLWLVYKIMENNCLSQLFPEFIQTQRRYPTSLNKISILNWTLVIVSSQNFSFELNSSRTFSSWSVSYISLWLQVQWHISLFLIENNLFPKIKKLNQYKKSH